MKIILNIFKINSNLLLIQGLNGIILSGIQKIIDNQKI